MQDWPGEVRSVFPVSTDNRCKLHFDWMIKRKQYQFLWCQQECMIFEVTSHYVAPMFLSPCGGACQTCAASGGRHMETPGKSGLALPRNMVTPGKSGLALPRHMVTPGKSGQALPRHMVTGGPNELSNTRQLCTSGDIASPWRPDLERDLSSLGGKVLGPAFSRWSLNLTVVSSWEWTLWEGGAAERSGDTSNSSVSGSGLDPENPLGNWLYPMASSNRPSSS